MTWLPLIATVICYLGLCSNRVAALQSPTSYSSISVAAYRRGQRQIKSYRGSAQTMREHAAAHPELADLVEVVEAAAYRLGAVDQGLLARIMAWRKTRQ